MSSLAQRQATGTWIMAGCILPCLEGADHDRLQAAVDAVRPYIVAPPFYRDRAMQRVHYGLRALVMGDKLFANQGIMTEDEKAATLYMCHALASDWADQCPAMPLTRKRVWRRLANVIAGIIKANIEGQVDDGRCAERGCQWAETVKGVLR